MGTGVYYHRFPFQAFFGYMKSHIDGFNTVICDRMLGRADGYTENQLRHDRRLNVWQADRLATSVGIHPSMIWDDWWNLDGDRDLPRRILV